MVQKKTLAISVASIVLVAGLSANAAFRSSSTGKGVAKPAPPAICVDVPATNTPCVETDDSAEYGDVLNLKNKAAASTLAKADIDALGLTIPASVNLNNADTIAYLNDKLNAGIASGNTPNPKKVSDISSIITGATLANVNLWVIGQAASGDDSYSITSTVLNNAGCEASLLADIDTNASTLDSNISSSGLSTSPSVTAVQNWATTTAGFATGVSYQDVLDATDSSDGGWTIADFKAASKKGYSKTSADRILYSEAKGGTYTAFCTAEVSSASACTELTKTQFNTAKAGVGLMNNKIAKVNAGTLTQADLTDLNLSFDDIGDPLQAWQLNYLETVLATASGTTKADWQTTLTNYTTAATHQFYLTNVALPKVSNNTLTQADLGSSGIDYSGIDSSLSDWQIDYLETVLATAAGTTKANWQTTVTGYSKTAASAWYLKKIADSSATSGDYAASNTTINLLKDAGVDSGLSALAGSCSNGTNSVAGIACKTLGITTAALGSSTTTALASKVRSHTFSSTPTAAEMRDLLTEASGFPSGTTYASVSTATGAGWTAADYKTALSNGGWDSSSGDKTKFASCKTSTAGDAAPAGTCSLSETEWDAVAAAPSDLSISWNSSMLSAFTIAANDGDGGISSFKGCDGWRNRALAQANKSGYSIEYSFSSTPSSFSSLSINSSTGRMSYTVASQSAASATNVTIVAKAKKNGVAHKTATKTVSVTAVNKTSNGSTWTLVRADGTHHTSVVQNNVRNINACPAGYEMATSSSDLTNARNMGMGAWSSSTWTQPSSHQFDSCGQTTLATCNTAGVTGWDHVALVYGKNSSNKACLVFENSGRNTSRTLAPDDGTCADHSIGTSGWCVVNYICKRTASTKLWP